MSSCRPAAVTQQQQQHSSRSTVPAVRSRVSSCVFHLTFSTVLCEGSKEPPLKQALARIKQQPRCSACSAVLLLLASIDVTQCAAQHCLNNYNVHKSVCSKLKRARTLVVMQPSMTVIARCCSRGLTMHSAAVGASKCSTVAAARTVQPSSSSLHSSTWHMRTT
jgi:hypothetical protein